MTGVLHRGIEKQTGYRVLWSIKQGALRNNRDSYSGIYAILCRGGQWSKSP